MCTLTYGAFELCQIYFRQWMFCRTYRHFCKENVCFFKQPGKSRTKHILHIIKDIQTVSNMERICYIYFKEADWQKLLHFKSNSPTNETDISTIIHEHVPWSASWSRNLLSFAVIYYISLWCFSGLSCLLTRLDPCFKLLVLLMPLLCTIVYTMYFTLGDK